MMKQFAEDKFEKFRIEQDKKYISDFDKIIDEYEKIVNSYGRYN